jgi:hypothetical protein
MKLFNRVNVKCNIILAASHQYEPNSIPNSIGINDPDVPENMTILNVVVKTQLKFKNDFLNTELIVYRINHFKIGMHFKTR